MNNYLFDRLSFYNPKIPVNCEEVIFFNENVMLFNQATNIYSNNYSTSAIIKADAILRSLYNKDFIDKYVKLLDEENLKESFIRDNIFEKVSSFKFQGVDIYIPVYDIETNKLYFNDLSSLKNKNNIYIKNTNYGIINPFEYYNDNLYDSTFTRLIKLDAQDDKYFAYYHLLFETIFIISKENGNIEFEIPLFDINIKQPDKKNLFNRLENIANIFFKDDEKTFLRELLENNFISNTFYREVMKDFLKKL